MYGNNNNYYYVLAPPTQHRVTQYTALSLNLIAVQDTRLVHQIIVAVVRTI